MISIKILQRGVRNLLKDNKSPSQTGLILDRIHERDIEFDSLQGHQHRTNGRTFTAKEAISKYDAVRITGSNLVSKADSTASKNAQVIGVATASVAANQRVPVVTWGEVVNSNWNFNPGEAVYVQSTPGLVGEGFGTWRGGVGIVLETNKVFVRPDLEVTSG